MASRSPQDDDGRQNPSQGNNSTELTAHNNADQSQAQQAILSSEKLTKEDFIATFGNRPRWWRSHIASLHAANNRRTLIADRIRELQALEKARAPEMAARQRFLQASKNVPDSLRLDLMVWSHWFNNLDASIAFARRHSETLMLLENEYSKTEEIWDDFWTAVEKEQHLPTSEAAVINGTGATEDHGDLAALVEAIRVTEGNDDNLPNGHELQEPAINNKCATTTVEDQESKAKTTAKDTITEAAELIKVHLSQTREPATDEAITAEEPKTEEEAMTPGGERLANITAGTTHYRNAHHYATEEVVLLPTPVQALNADNQSQDGGPLTPTTTTTTSSEALLSMEDIVAKLHEKHRKHRFLRWILASEAAQIQRLLKGLDDPEWIDWGMDELLLSAAA